MKSLVKKIKDLLSDATLLKIDVYAAASSFGFVVSVIPFLIILLMLVPYTPLTEENLLLTTEMIIPSGIKEFVAVLIESLKSGIRLLPFTIIVMFWSSSLMMIYIRHGLNDIYECVEKQNYLLLRIFGTLFLLFAALLIVITSTIGLIGGNIREFLLSLGFKPMGTINFILRYRALLVIGAQTLIFTMMYCIVPSVKNRFKSQIIGALFTSVANYIYLIIFDFLMGNYLDFSMYGSLATIVVIMFYFYFIFYFFFLGALINRKILVK